MQVYSWMDTLVADYPRVVSKEQIGLSYESRPMYVLKVHMNICYTLEIFSLQFETLFI